MDYTTLITEQRNPRSQDLDRMTTGEILQVINAEDRLVPEAVGRAIPQITKAADLIVARMKNGGRLIYVGAGTSGRLGILDAAECPPTFGVGPDAVSAIIAGGDKAVFRAVEESEDDEVRGYEELLAMSTSGDAVVGISASGVTPFVRGALRAARQNGAATVAVVCNRVDPGMLNVDVAISLIVGPEVLTGSTRMKAGTAQKLVLNMISTTAMIRMGKVYENLMVDMHPTNRKLHDRAIRIVSMATGADTARAAALLSDSGGSIKVAIVMELSSSGRDAAEAALKCAAGHVRAAVELIREEHPLDA